MYIVQLHTYKYSNVTTRVYCTAGCYESHFKNESFISLGFFSKFLIQKEAKKNSVKMFYVEAKVATDF